MSFQRLTQFPVLVDFETIEDAEEGARFWFHRPIGGIPHDEHPTDCICAPQCVPASKVCSMSLDDFNHMMVSAVQ